jgi:hypothetical protein
MLNLRLLFRDCRTRSYRASSLMMVAFFPAFPLRLVWNGFTRYHHLTKRENFLPGPKIHTLNGLPPTGYVQSRYVYQTIFIWIRPLLGSFRICDRDHICPTSTERILLVNLPASYRRGLSGLEPGSRYPDYWFHHMDSGVCHC